MALHTFHAGSSSRSGTKYAHGDFHLNNIVIDDKGDPHLIDFENSLSVISTPSLPDIRGLLVSKENISQDFKGFILENENAVIKLVQHYVEFYGMRDFDTAFSLLISDEGLFKTGIRPFIEAARMQPSAPEAPTVVDKSSELQMPEAARLHWFLFNDHQHDAPTVFSPSMVDKTPALSMLLRTVDRFRTAITFATKLTLLRFKLDELPIYQQDLPDAQAEKLVQTLNNRNEQIHTVYHALETLQTEIRQTAGDRELMVRQVASLKKNYQEWLVSEALGDHDAAARWANELHFTCQGLQGNHPGWIPLLERISQHDITPQPLPVAGAPLEQGIAEASTGAEMPIMSSPPQPAHSTVEPLNISFIWAGSLRDSTGIFKPSAIDRVCEMARKLPNDEFKINYYCNNSEVQALKNEFSRRGFGNNINVYSIDELLEELKDDKPDTDIAKYHQLMKYFSDHNMHNHIKEFLAPVIVYLKAGYFFDTTVMVDEEIGTINLPHPQGPLLASNPIRHLSHHGGFSSGFRPTDVSTMQKGALDVWAYASGQPKDEFYHELLDLFFKVFEFEFLNMDDRKWETSAPLFDYTKIEIGRPPNDVVAPMVFPVRQLSSKASGRIQRGENDKLTIDGEATGIIKVIKGSWRSIMLPDIRRMMLGKTNIGQDFKDFILAHENAVIKLVQHYMRTYGGDFDNNLSLLIDPYYEALFRTEIAPFIKQDEEFSSRAAATVLPESSAAAFHEIKKAAKDLRDEEKRDAEDPNVTTPSR